jgi:hypothetical protein
VNGNEQEYRQLIADLLDAYELLTAQIVVANPDYEVSEEEMHDILYRLEDRFRKLAPAWPGVLPSESPIVTESMADRVKRLLQS